MEVYGRCSDLILVIYRLIPGGTEENHKKI
jgi:hypothetical protein